MIGRHGTIVPCRWLLLWHDNDWSSRYDGSLQVTVTDKGNPQLQDVANVIINILDANNKDPYVDPFLQNFEVYDSMSFLCYNKSF